MAITFRSESTGATAADATENAVRAYQFQQPDLMASAAEISACYKFLSVIEICAYVDPSALSAKIEVKVLGTTVFTGEISQAHPCLSLKIDPHVGPVGVDLKLDICMDLSSRCITASGHACVHYVFDKKCADLNKHCIVHF